MIFKWFSKEKRKTINIHLKHILNWLKKLWIASFWLHYLSWNEFETIWKEKKNEEKENKIQNGVSNIAEVWKLYIKIRSNEKMYYAILWARKSWVPST